MHTVQLQHEVPVTLVLGGATSASAVAQQLPVAACDCLRMQPFPLMPVSWMTGHTVSQMACRLAG